MEKKKYDSKKVYSKEWAKYNVNVSLNRELINKLKIVLNDKQSIKSYIEDLIEKKIV
jgi:hypothetical protein